MPSWVKPPQPSRSPSQKLQTPKATSHAIRKSGTQALASPRPLMLAMLPVFRLPLILPALVLVLPVVLVLLVLMLAVLFVLVALLVLLELLIPGVLALQRVLLLRSPRLFSGHHLHRRHWRQPCRKQAGVILPR